MKVELNYEAADRILVDILKNAYEHAYSCFIDDSEKYAKDKVKYEFKAEDLIQHAEVLQAMEVLAGHFTPRESGKEELRKIRDSLEAKLRIGKMRA